MSKREFVDSKGQTWEWEESKEFVELLQTYWNLVEDNNKEEN
jgi:hypothetical protein